MPVDFEVFPSVWTHQTCHPLLQKSSPAFSQNGHQTIWVRIGLEQDVPQRSKHIISENLNLQCFANIQCQYKKLRFLVLLSHKAKAAYS